LPAPFVRARTSAPKAGTQVGGADVTSALGQLRGWQPSEDEDDDDELAPLVYAAMQEEAGGGPAGTKAVRCCCFRDAPPDDDEDPDDEADEGDRRRLAKCRSGQTGCDGRVACWMAEEEADDEGDRRLGRLGRGKRGRFRSGTAGGPHVDVSYECWDQ
jgi:hypothetical protein